MTEAKVFSGAIFKFPFEKISIPESENTQSENKNEHSAILDNQLSENQSEISDDSNNSYSNHLRQSKHLKNKAEVLTYDTFGGNPTFVNGDGNNF